MAGTLSLSTGQASPPGCCRVSSRGVGPGSRFARAAGRVGRYLCLLAILLPPAAARGGDANACLYLPPEWEADVLYYRSFDGEAAEVNGLGAKVILAKGRAASGVAGRGWAPSARRPTVALSGVGRPLTRPITASVWFRLDEPMKPETGFDLIALRAGKGYISNFVRGRGGWCALTRPTFVVQVYRFPGISNVNGIRYGHAWLDANAWHHAAVVVSGGGRVSVLWNGTVRYDYAVKGRLFGPGDVLEHIHLGPSGGGHRMTADELLVLGRAASPEEIRRYITAVRRLAEAGFQPTVGKGTTWTKR